MKKENPLPDFFTTPCTPSKEFENDCASMVLRKDELKFYQKNKKKFLRQFKRRCGACFFLV
jgi:hypothetical protein